MKSYSKEDQLFKKVEAKEKCKVFNCNLFRLDGDDSFCKGHRNQLRFKPKIESSRARKKSKKNKVKGDGYQLAFEKAKSSFQRLRRAMCAGEIGHKDMVYCRCTKKIYHWDDGRRVHGGHLIGAVFKPTCFDEMNVFPQAAISNLTMGDGHQERLYVEWYLKEYGQKFYDSQLIKSKQYKKKWSVFELKEMKAKFDYDLVKLINEKGLSHKAKLPIIRKDYREKLLRK